MKCIIFVVIFYIVTTSLRLFLGFYSNFELITLLKYNKNFEVIKFMCDISTIHFILLKAKEVKNDELAKEEKTLFLAKYTDSLSNNLSELSFI